jgi:hypothetical protein
LVAIAMGSESGNQARNQHFPAPGNDAKTILSG